MLPKIEDCVECGKPLEVGQNALCLDCTEAKWRAENPRAAADLRDAQEEMADQLESMWENPDI